MEYAEFLIRTLQKASDIATLNFGKVSGVVKNEDNNQVLTKTDLEIGQKIIQEIQTFYPSYNIIDEEAGAIDNHSEYTWVVDPIDGTSNFSSGIPTFGIMIGLLHNTIPIAGGIALPAFNQICTAEKGFGSFLNGAQIHVTSENKLLNTLVAYHIDGHQENPDITRKETVLLADIILKVRNLRIFETCYDSVILAEGKIGGYLNKTSKIWDNVAPQIIVEEAGGIFTDFYGNSMDYNNALTRLKDNYTQCAAPPALHKQLQEIIRLFQTQ